MEKPKTKEELITEGSRAIANKSKEQMIQQLDSINTMMADLSKRKELLEAELKTLE